MGGESSMSELVMNSVPPQSSWCWNRMLHLRHSPCFGTRLHKLMGRGQVGTSVIIGQNDRDCMARFWWRGGVVVCYVSTVGEHRLSLVGLEVVSKES